MRQAIDTVMGVYELARLGAMSGFRFRGAYWTWRLHTAFGRGAPTTRRERIAAVLEHGRWIRRMRRYM